MLQAMDRSRGNLISEKRDDRKGKDSYVVFGKCLLLNNKP